MHRDGSRPLKKWDSHYQLEFSIGLEPSLCIFEVNCMSNVDNLCKTVDRLQVMVDRLQEMVDKNPKTVHYSQIVNFSKM
jgi:hypothetical protein